jgi:hypothetical protein
MERLLDVADEMDQKSEIAAAGPLVGIAIL